MKRRRRAKLPKGERFITLHHWMLESPAFLELSGNQVKLIVLLCWRFNGSNNGKISMSVREAAEEIGCCINHASKCFHELERRGFIHATERGAFKWRAYDDNSGRRHASTWRLTWLPTKNSRALNGLDEASKEFMRCHAEAKIQEPVSNEATKCLSR